MRAYTRAYEQGEARHAVRELDPLLGVNSPDMGYLWLRARKRQTRAE